MVDQCDCCRTTNSNLLNTRRAPSAVTQPTSKKGSLWYFKTLE